MYILSAAKWFYNIARLPEREILIYCRAGGLVQQLQEETHIRIQALDAGWTFLTFVLKLYCCLKRPKINKKEAGDGPFLKKQHFGLNPIKKICSVSYFRVCVWVWVRVCSLSVKNLKQSMVVLKNRVGSIKLNDNYLYRIGPAKCVYYQLEFLTTVLQRFGLYNSITFQYY